MGELESNSIIEFVMEKLKELLVLLENFGGFLVDEAEKLFPAAESREEIAEKVREWIQVGAPFVILGLAVVLLYCCLSRCCCRGRSRGKMMKAPGRGGGHLISRTAFESDPSGYFRNLHARR